MKRKLVAILTALALLLSLATPFGAMAADSTVDLYYNGDIQTVDADMNYVEALAVKDGKILATGTLAEVEKAAGADANRVDLNGTTLLPGFYDAHSHFLMAAVNDYTSVALQSPPMGSIKDMNELVAALAARAAETEAGGWVVGAGYDDGQLAEKVHPTAADLDKASTEHPIVITHFSAHNTVVNTKALELAGITKDTPDPEGGQIGRDADGNPNGQLWENAMGLVSKLQPEVTHEQRLKAMEAMSDIYAAAGVTTANEGYGIGTWALYQEAYDKGLMDVRTSYWFGKVDEGVAAREGLQAVGDNWYDKDGMLGITGIKFLQDGSPQLRTAFLTDPYFTSGTYPEDWVAYPWQSGEELMKMVVNAHQNGFNHMFIHGNGDAAIDDVINAYAEVKRGVEAGEYRDVSLDQLRHIVIHCQFSREDQFDRMAELKTVMPSFLIMHPYYLGDRHWTQYFGPDRAARMSATRDALNRDIVMSLHADTPVFPMNPMLMWDTAVNRQSYTGRDIFTTTYKEGDKYRSVDQRITPAEALRGLTIAGAYQSGEEKITGSLEVGKNADLVVLAENPLKLADTKKIKDVKVLKTIVGGKVVFDASPANDGFVDIAGHWAYDEIIKSSRAAIFGGVSADRFDPDAQMTRGMVVSVLHRVAGVSGEPVPAGTDFTDVNDGDWFAVPVAWASANKVVAGMGDGTFAPNDPITREQFSAMLMNFAKYQGKDLGTIDTAVLDAYTDKALVDDWAKESVSFAVQTGVIRGMTADTIAPDNTTTRAEAATMMNRFIAS